MAATTVAGASTSLLSAPKSRFSQDRQGLASSLAGVQLVPQSKNGFRKKNRPGFTKPVPLQIVREAKAFLHVEYKFYNATAFDSLEPVVLTVSTPLPPGTPVGSDVDPNFKAEIVKELRRVYRLPSPESVDVSINVDIKRHPYADLQVGDRWREIQGSQDWEGLMDNTMDPVLRGELIRYGEFAQATYDAFENDPSSEFCGNAKFDKKELLEEVGLENRGYEIIDYIYATSSAHLPKFFSKSHQKDEKKWSKDSNFMGYVAVCTDPEEIQRLGRRDIVVAWRGTVTKLEWLENVRDFFSPTGLDPRGKTSDVMVESGFLDVYKSSNENSRYNKLSAREQVLSTIKKVIQKYKRDELSITVTGHSLGSALSMLCAYDIAESGINKINHSPRVPVEWNDTAGATHADPHQHSLPDPNNRVPVSVFSFAGPRLGNPAFKERVEELGVKVLRVVNKHDIVPKVPGIIFNEKLQFLHKLASWLPCSYVHIGRELEFDSNVSQFLRDVTDPVDAHNLEAYLHMIDGYHGPNAPFSPAVKRDIALVNKASDFLEHHLGIPANWWEQELMVKDPDTGRWVLRSTVGETVYDQPATA